MGKLHNLTFCICAWSFTLLTACSSDYSHREFKTGPQNQNELGLLVSGLKLNELENVLEQHPQAQYRLLNEDLGAYEITGLNKAELLELNPTLNVEPNRLIKLNSHISEGFKTQARKILQSQRQTPSEFFEGCGINDKMALPKLEITNKDQISFPLSIEDRLSIEVRLLSRKPGDFAWAILAPHGSLIKPNLGFEKNFKLTFDMAGTFGVVLFYKKNNICNFDVFELNVTSNEPYVESPQSLSKETSKKLDAFKFYHLDVVKAHEALDRTSLKEEIVTAVIDTGVNYNHPLLANKIWTNKDEVIDGIDNDGNGYVDDVVGFDFYHNDNSPLDDMGHGTHVAGLIAADKVGVAPSNSKIMALKVGSSSSTDHGSLISAISYAVKKDVHIINLSLGGLGKSSILELALEQARQKNILVVAASGNGNSRGVGINNDNLPLYPASYNLDNVLSVASSTGSGELTNYSNYGKESVDIAAPGGYSNDFEPIQKMIFSAYVKNPSNLLLQPLQGTSMATPIVAGVAALLLGEAPELPPQSTIQILTQTGTTSYRLEGLIKSGKTVNAASALEALVAF